jgi:hypothetical protein
MAKRLGAESVTNDEQGHILDPDAARVLTTTSVDI